MKVTFIQFTTKELDTKFLRDILSDINIQFTITHLIIYLDEYIYNDLKSTVHDKVSEIVNEQIIQLKLLE